MISTSCCNITKLSHVLPGCGLGEWGGVLVGVGHPFWCSSITFPWEFHREESKESGFQKSAGCPVGRSTGRRDHGLRQLRLSQAPEPICRSVYLLESVFPRPRHPSFDKKLRVFGGSQVRSHKKQRKQHPIRSNTIITFGNLMGQWFSSFVQ